jgi:DNA polymerase elongation subunit (family B)
MEQKDYISYSDTDSLFIMFGAFLQNSGIDMDVWNKLPQSKRTPILIKLSKAVEKVVNERSFASLQKGDYNSLVPEDDFSIKFKQEIICSNMLHLGPKMYAYHVVNNEGFDCDDIEAKGVEIIRSTSPKVFREALKSLLEHLLKGKDDEFLSNIIEEYKKGFYSAKPEDISINIGINNIAEYISEDFSYGKGTPYHLKGVANYHFLLNQLGISNKYEQIKEGDKCRVVYLRKNRFAFDVISYYRWPEEFASNGILVDYQTMIDKYFLAKASIFLDPINRQKVLDDKSTMDLFF